MNSSQIDKIDKEASHIKNSVTREVKKDKGKNGQINHKEEEKNGVISPKEEKSDTNNNTSHKGQGPNHKVQKLTEVKIKIGNSNLKRIIDSNTQETAIKTKQIINDFSNSYKINKTICIIDSAFQSISHL